MNISSTTTQGQLTISITTSTSDGDAVVGVSVVDGHPGLGEVNVWVARDGHYIYQYLTADEARQLLSKLTVGLAKIDAAQVAA